MSVKIRLAKFGKRHAPSYRLVVCHTRTKRNGKFLDILGHYNPSDPKAKLTVDKEKMQEWVNKGALQTEAVKELLEGKYTYVKYAPKKSGTANDSKEEAPKKEEEAPVVEETETVQEEA